MSQLLEGLTEAQRRAVLHVEGPLLILAGPGSGKTRVVTHRIAYLVEQGIPDRQILALTFTNKAADEMRRRVECLSPGQSVWISTFHRFCARLLRKYAPLVGLQENYTIYDADDSLRALRRTLAGLGLDCPAFSPETIASAISWAKNNLILPEQYQARPGHAVGAVVQRIYPAYQARLRSSNAADFDDLLLHVATLLRENPEIRQELDERYCYILVDEYQDTNLAQYAIARALSIDHPNLAVTGDPDQSIYGWRGANLQNLLEFERDFPRVRVVRLERNYRSTKRILSVADHLIRHNVKRKQKELYTENGEGAPVRLVSYATQKEEAEQIVAAIAEQIRSGRRRPRDFAIFYRINALSRAFEFALREHAVPYQMVNGLEFFQRKEIKDVLGYLQLVTNPQNEQAFLRVVNTPTRGVGKTAVERLTAHGVRHGVSLMEAARDARKIEALSKRAAGALAQFVAMADRLAAAATGPVEEIMGLVLSETGYQESLSQSETEEDAERLANIQELLTVAREFDERYASQGPLEAFDARYSVPGSLEAFLEEASLVNDVDAWETDSDRVTLMTLHASKGLEFPAVFLTAVEEGLLPHERSRHDANQLEEERRLMFVGITRAQQELQISRAQYRDFRGQRKQTVPSLFLMELPRAEMEIREQEPPASTPAWTEPVWEEPAFRPEAETTETTVKRTSLALRLTTAAELANGGQPLGPISSDVFRQGMVVRHPEYGLGRIVALSGAGRTRRATVDFPGPGRLKFVLEKSPLRPVG